MSDRQFIEKIYELAEAIKESPLSDYEKKVILDAFNQETGSAFDRAKKAVKKIIGPEYLVEKTASLDNSDRIISDLRRQAELWQKSKEKK